MLDEPLEPVPFEPAPDAIEALPSAVLAVLERRYLDDFDNEAWRLLPADSSPQRPVLSEIRQLGSRRQSGGTDPGLSSLLTACADPGHALMLVIKGEQARQRLFLGVRRQPGASESTADRLHQVTSAFQTALPGLEFDADTNVPDDAEDRLEDFSNFAVITGIPSPASGVTPWSGLDNVLHLARGSEFQLTIIAEPLGRERLERSIEALRHIRSELHGLVRRTHSVGQSKNRGGGNSRVAGSVDPGIFIERPNNLLGLSRLASAAAATGLRMLGPFAEILSAGAHFAGGSSGPAATVQTNWSTTRQSGLSYERLDAIAEACEQAVEQHLRRLQSAVAGGFWRVTVYIAAHGQRDLGKIAGALRGHLTGEASYLDPIRSIDAPADLVRDCMRRGRGIDFAPRARPPAGAIEESFDVLATQVSSRELAHLFALPQSELPGLPLRQRVDFGLTAPPAHDRSIVLGQIEDRDGRLLADLPLRASSLNRNALVVGLVGSGKTTSCQRLLTSAWMELGVPFLVIEPVKTEYREMATQPGLAGRLNVFSISSGESAKPFSAPLRLNPLQPVPGFPVARHLDLLKAVFNAAFPMFAGMSYVLEEALVDVYAERGWPVRDEGVDATALCRGPLERAALMPDLRGLHDRVEQVLQKKGYGQEIQSNMGAALRSRLNSLLLGHKGALFDTRESTPAELLFSRPAVIELHQLGDDEEKSFVMALLFVLLCEHAEVRRQELPAAQRGQLQHLTLIEEAHRLLAAPRGSVGAESADARGKAVQMFTDLLAEMRAYGEGFIVADQIPTKLAPEILKNTALKIAHRLTSPDDRNAMGGACNLSNEQVAQLNLLAPGQAIVHDADIGQAVRVRVRGVATTAVDATATSARGGNNATWLRFGGGCEPCTEPCRWRRGLPGSELAQSVGLALQGLVRKLLDPSGLQMQIAPADAMDAPSGRVHCAALLALRRQMEDWLGSRRAALGGAGLQVTDRIHVERCLGLIGLYLHRWAAGETITQEEWQALRKAWSAIVATSPPRMRPGCRQCPSPCTALYEAATCLGEASTQVRALVDGVQPAALRLEAFEKTTARLGDMPSRDMREARTIRYCIAVVCAGERPTPSAQALMQALIDSAA